MILFVQRNWDLGPCCWTCARCSAVWEGTIGTIVSSLNVVEIQSKMREWYDVKVRGIMRRTQRSTINCNVGSNTQMDG